MRAGCLAGPAWLAPHCCFLCEPRALLTFELVTRIAANTASGANVSAALEQTASAKAQATHLRCMPVPPA